MPGSPENRDSNFKSHHCHHNRLQFLTELSETTSFHFFEKDAIAADFGYTYHLNIQLPQQLAKQY